MDLVNCIFSSSIILNFLLSFKRFAVVCLPLLNWRLVTDGARSIRACFCLLLLLSLMKLFQKGSKCCNFIQCFLADFILVIFTTAIWTSRTALWTVRAGIWTLSRTCCWTGTRTQFDKLWFWGFGQSPGTT